MGYVQEAGVCLFLGGLVQPRGAQRQGWWLGAALAVSSRSSGSLGVSQSKTSPLCFMSPLSKWFLSRAFLAFAGA